MSLCTLQASTVLVCSGHVMNGMCSLCSYRWDTVGNGSSVLMEYHGSLVWKLSALMEYQKELVWKWSTLMSCGSLFTRGVP